MLLHCIIVFYSVILWRGGGIGLNYSTVCYYIVLLCSTWCVTLEGWRDRFQLFYSMLLHCIIVFYSVILWRDRGIGFNYSTVCYYIVLLCSTWCVTLEGWRDRFQLFYSMLLHCIIVFYSVLLWRDGHV